MYALDKNGSGPIYLQLYRQIRGRILSGELPAGARLPSVRDLADQLVASRNTVQNAYLELQAEGYIGSRPQSGYFVTPLNLDAALAPHGARPAGAAPEPPQSWAFDFHPARLDAASMPATLWRRLFLECFRESFPLFSESPGMQGEWELRRCIRQYLELSRGVLCAEDQIVVCAGLQNALDLVAHLLRDERPPVAVENPGYRLPRAVFRNHSFWVCPIPVDSEGLDVDRLKASPCAVAYVTPSHQFPTGCVMPVSRRLKLLEWAGSAGRVLIEDDYDSELRYVGKPIRALQGLNPEANVIYMGSFSKVLSPSLRMSYMILPRALLPRFRQMFSGYLSSVPLLNQRIMAEFMARGDFERHARRMRTIYKSKRKAMIEAIARHFGPEATVLGSEAGLHVVLQLPGSAPGEAAVLARARSQGIRLIPYSQTYDEAGRDEKKLLLGFGGLDAEDIGPGIAALAPLCR